LSLVYLIIFVEYQILYKKSYRNNYDIRLDAVAYICNPVSRGRDWNDRFEASPGKKVSETPSQSISWVLWFTPVVPTMWQAKDRKITVRGQPWAKP
jgi:hypothetical protein